MSRCEVVNDALVSDTRTMAGGALSIRPRWRPWLLGIGLGLVLGLVAARVSWSLVRADAERAEAAGIAKGGPYRFVGGMAVLAAALGFWVGRRLGRGRSTEVTGWILSMDRMVPHAASYREAEPPSVGLLLERLAVHGYQLEARLVTADGTLGQPIDPRTALAGSAFWLHDKRLGPAVTGVELRLSALVDRSAGGLATVRAVDTQRAAGCVELALFTIVELGALVRELHCRRDDSQLSGDPVELLRATLPERPRLR